MAIYLDNNATTALNPQVLEVMLPFVGAVCGNPSSVHRFGRLQRDAIEQAREQLARLAGAQADQVIFTSGGTEANNLILRGLSAYAGKIHKQKQIKRVAVSAIEHLSVLKPAHYLFDEVDYIAVDGNGCVKQASLERVLDANAGSETGLVSVMTANNETGVIQSLRPLINCCRQSGVLFHTDATQAAGKIALDFSADGINAMTLSAHKIYGPAGIGALIIDQTVPLQAVQSGGSQEKNRRAGTENVAAIVGFGKAAEMAVELLSQRQAHTRQLQVLLEQGLKKIPAVTVFAEQAKRLSNTVQFTVAGFEGESLLMQLDRKAIAVSSGSACTSGKTQPSHVLQAMHIPDAIASGAIRVSFGENNTVAETETLLNALHEIINANRSSSVMMAASL